MAGKTSCCCCCRDALFARDPDTRPQAVHPPSPSPVAGPVRRSQHFAAAVILLCPSLSRVSLRSLSWMLTMLECVVGCKRLVVVVVVVDGGRVKIACAHHSHFSTCPHCIRQQTLFQLHGGSEERVALSSIRPDAMRPLKSCRRCDVCAAPRVRHWHWHQWQRIERVCSAAAECACALSGEETKRDEASSAATERGPPDLLVDGRAATDKLLAVQARLSAHVPARRLLPVNTYSATISNRRS